MPTPPRIRAVHLDLKGLPPTEHRLLTLLDLFVAAGYNAVLVEWEDAFPWTVDERLRSPTAYALEAVQRFVDRAAELNVELIPLVQCLGHMETPLRLTEYAALREQPDRCDCLNPLAEGAAALVQAMVDDVLARMPGVKHVHLGGDEAWAFATHPDTRAYAERHGRDALYLKHVEPLLDHLAERGIRPLLWHDMMIRWSDNKLCELARKADLVVWGYVGHPDEVDHHFNSRYTERFHQLGVPLWAAGAYKGADGMDADLPDLTQRRHNAEAWMQLHDRFDFCGVIATAWSRYSTHRIQNEPIEGALDALAIVGSIFQGKDGQDWKQVLRDAGEDEHWCASQSALHALTEARREAWHHVQLIHQHIAVAELATMRRGCGCIEHARQGLDCALVRFDAAAERVRATLAPHVPKLWIDEYLQSRRMPLDGARHALPSIASCHDRPRTAAGS